MLSPMIQNFTQAVSGSDQHSVDLPRPIHSALDSGNQLATDETYVTVTVLYKIFPNFSKEVVDMIHQLTFPNFSKKVVDMIHHLTGMNGTLTVNTLLDIYQR